MTTPHQVFNSAPSTLAESSGSQTSPQEDSSEIENQAVQNVPSPGPGVPSHRNPATVTTNQRTLSYTNPSEGIITKDFYFFPIPQRLQHHPHAPVRFNLALNVGFGIASTFLIANIYYCQPILVQLSTSFDVTYNEVSRIPTLIQAGYATGLLLISPLGDLIRRRPLPLLLTFISIILTIPLAVTHSISVFESFSFLVGATSVVPQILIPLAADLSPPERRATALSIVLSGLLLGILIARVMAGIIAQFVTWRIVYYVAMGVQGIILIMLYWMLPDYPQRNKGITYWGILWSMMKFLVREPVVVQAALVCISSMATFANFWVTLTFLLDGPPYYYSTIVIGLFGLIGIFGVAMAPLVGRAVDNLVPWFATMIGSLGLVVFQAIQTGAGGINISAVILTAFGIDVFRQMQQVSVTNQVFGLEFKARARLNAILIISLFIGQVMGTSVGTKVYTQYGWRPAAALSVAWTGFSILVLLLRGPNCGRYTWIGWEGGFEVRKSRIDTHHGLDGSDLEKVAEPRRP
ncbi:major facilitator superfamily domain-containing protein [Abortiporus biennis]|nr:major facilitator superfamily domain-containing protein [Abortiporus biennis]